MSACQSLNLDQSQLGLEDIAKRMLLLSHYFLKTNPNANIHLIYNIYYIMPTEAMTISKIHSLVQVLLDCVAQRKIGQVKIVITV